MIKNLYENEVGYMVGTFYADIFGYEIEVWFKKNISIEYIKRNINYLNNLDMEFLVKICNALKRYYEDYRKILPDLCDDIQSDIIEEFEKNPTSILNYINIGVCRFDEYSGSEEDIPVIKLGGNCAWSGDEGVTIAAKNNQLLYVGPWTDFNVWISNANVMFNYAILEN